MKFVKGWYLPDSDTHFEHYIKDGSYQTVHRETILRYIIHLCLKHLFMYFMFNF